jgi:hypothetical protein
VSLSGMHKNNTRWAAALAGCLTLAAQSATTTTVIDIPAASGGTQRYLHIRPDAPIATVIHVPGGDGNFSFQSDGASSTATGQCSPVLRSREAFAAAGIAIAAVDRTSVGLIYNYDDILEVVRSVRARDNVPVWVSGGSASTSTIELLARSLPGDVGAVFYSPTRPSSRAGEVRRPSMVIYHSGDSGAFGATMFNALTGAVVRERNAISTGTNVGCGFHLFNGAEAEFAASATSFITRHNAATRSATPNYQGLWWRQPALSESGWGVNLTHQASTLFGTWFTYDTDGRGMWLVMPSGVKGAGETYTGALYRTTGPAYSVATFDPAQVAATDVGSATFSFTDGDNGTFAYVVNGVAQSKAITRQVYAQPMPECVAGAGHGASPNYQALWWGGPAESGWGINVAHQADIVFATWFTYDTDGRDLWLVMPSGARTGPGAYSGALYRTTGPAFDAQPWSPTGVAATEMGTGAFLFDDAEHGTFTYTVGGVTRSKAIVRQVFASPATVCR